MTLRCSRFSKQLLKAAKNGLAVGVVQALLQKGACPDAIDNDGKSALPVTPAPANRKDPRFGRLLSGRVLG